ncbi:MAG TPA: MFS transporter [Polyangiaceae bacterium]|jgi:MFS family permease
MSPRALLFITLFNSILGLSILFPILGPLGRQLGLTEFQIGSLSTAYSVMQFLFSPYWGKLSERVGRKRILLVGVLGFGVSFLSFGLAADYGMRVHLATPTLYVLLLSARLLGGTFSSATLPTAQAYMADSTGRADRTAGMALVGAAFGLGVVFGPGIGALLSKISLLAAVYASVCVAFLNAVFVAIYLPESKRAVGGERARGVWALAGSVWLPLAIGFTLSFASVALEQTISFYFQDRLHLSNGGTPPVVGSALVVYGLIAVFAQGFLVRRYKWAPSKLLLLGIPIALAGYVTLIFAHQFLTLTLALAAQGLGQGLSMPGVTAALSLAVGDSDQGGVAGLSSSMQAFGRMLGPLVGTTLYQLRPEYPYALSGVLLICVLLAFSTGRVLTRAVGGAPP